MSFRISSPADSSKKIKNHSPGLLARSGIGHGARTGGRGGGGARAGGSCRLGLVTFGRPLLSRRTTASLILRLAGLLRVPLDTVRPLFHGARSCRGCSGFGRRGSIRSRGRTHDRSCRYSLSSCCCRCSRGGRTTTHLQLSFLATECFVVLHDQTK
jgi:hypothetical protein